ncbi:MAG: hypothetical protein WCS42_03740 [Verrucomicrobiota bacterium]
MKTGKPLPLVELAVLVFAAWQSLDLPVAWRHSPHDRFGWLALLVWLTPLALRLAGRPRVPLAANPWLLGSAILAGLLGQLTEVHFFGHVALALAVAAWVEISWRLLPWLLSAVAWMPVFGWWLAGFSGGTVFALRLALALAGAFFLWPKIKTRTEP